MSRTYRFVPRIANHKVQRMPHLVAMATGKNDAGARHLTAARGVLIGGAACAVFWVVALSAIL